MSEILEHEILKALYSFVTTKVAEGSEAYGYVPIYDRLYDRCSLHFGTLVDLLNAPDKYTLNKRPEGDLDYMQTLVLKIKDINTSKYSFTEVADAIDVLLLNGHIEIIDQNAQDGIRSKKIVLLDKGVIDYRNKYYLKLLDAEEIRTISNKVSRIDYHLKKYGFWYDILKGAVGGVIGALITLAASKIEKSQGAPTNKSPTEISPPKDSLPMSIK